MRRTAARRLGEAEGEERAAVRRAEGKIQKEKASMFGYLFWKQFSVSKTAKRVFEGYMSVWLVVFKTKTSKTKTPEKHEIRKQL